MNEIARVRPNTPLTSPDSELILRSGRSDESFGTPAKGPRTEKDLGVYLLFIALGVLQFIMSCRAPDFVGDSTYFELAKSIIAGTGYGFNFKPQTMLPPGFPYLVALLCIAVGTSYAVLIRWMAVFTTLGFIAAYELLRSQENRAVAFVSCLLLASSPEIFRFSSRLIFSDMPYFFLSMLLLLVLMRLDSTKDRRIQTILWWVLGCGLLLASVLIRSSGIALLGGTVAWIAWSFLTRQPIKHRLQLFLPLVVVGIAAQAMWMSWAARNQFSEWPIHGYQEHYLSQLKMKNGNSPELGQAAWTDVVSRPVHNADDNAAALVTLLTRKRTVSTWYSPAALIPLALLLLGFGYSFWKNQGSLVEWYFLTYATMFLFWPWDFELRFLLPVAPLGCLYLWRGGALLYRLALRKPREVGATSLVVAVSGFLAVLKWGLHVQRPSPRLCIALWLLAASVSIVLLQGGRNIVQKVSVALKRAVSVRGRSIAIWQALSGVTVMGLFVIGLAMQFTIGLANLHFRLQDDGFYPDIEAAEWIKGHSKPSTIVMARKEDLVYHYSQRRVIWFPPSSNARILMDGIYRYHVQYVVVTDGNEYWKPTSFECFTVLIHAYPDAFHLVHEGEHDRVYAVASDLRAVMTQDDSLARR